MAYRTQSEDTSVEVEKLQFDLMRRAGVTGRLQRARALSSAVIGLSRRGFAQRNPELTEREQLLLWVAAHYGEELAQCVEKNRSIKLCHD